MRGVMREQWEPGGERGGLVKGGKGEGPLKEPESKKCRVS